jgi:hypothetical protein
MQTQSNATARNRVMPPPRRDIGGIGSDTVECSLRTKTGGQCRGAKYSKQTSTVDDWGDRLLRSRAQQFTFIVHNASKRLDFVAACVVPGAISRTVPKFLRPPSSSNKVTNTIHATCVTYNDESDSVTITGTVKGVELAKVFNSALHELPITHAPAGGSDSE